MQQLNPTFFLEVMLAAIIGSYAVFTFALLFFWKKNKTGGDSSPEKKPFVSVIIPVRNEEENIGLLLEDLFNQTYPKDRFEILVMNDGSTDGTAEIVTQFLSKAECSVRLIPLPTEKTTSPKKRAIETAILLAKGELIITTDGDCRVGPGWIAAFAACQVSTGATLISGPVTFTREHSLTDQLQTVEFASLVGSGASAIAAGYPSLCNGANLAYLKTAFNEVSGFEGVKHIASGDDEFLMHKIAARFPGRVCFLKSPEAIVSTGAHQSWKAFFRQRKRWASKWKHYQSRTPLVLALYIFACNFSLITAMVLCLAGTILPSHFLALAAVKCIPEWFFLGTVLHFLKKTRSILLIPVTQLIYPFYVCFFGLAAQRPEYEWKGRKLV